MLVTSLRSRIVLKPLRQTSSYRFAKLNTNQNNNNNNDNDNDEYNSHIMAEIGYKTCEWLGWQLCDDDSDDSDRFAIISNALKTNGYTRQTIIYLCSGIIVIMIVSLGLVIFIITAAFATAFRILFVSVNVLNNVLDKFIDEK